MLSTLSPLPILPAFFPAMGLPLSHGKLLTAHRLLIDRSLTAVKNRIDRFSRRRNIMTHLHPSFSPSRIAVNAVFHSGQ